MIDGYAAAQVIKALLEKGFNPFVLVGFGLVFFAIRQGLTIVRDYTAGKDNATSRLIEFIEKTQQRQDLREDRMIEAVEKLNENLTRLNSRADVQDQFVRPKLEKINEDIWRSRGLDPSMGRGLGA